MLTNFHNSFTVGFCNKYATKHVLYFPPHLKHVTTLPCKTSDADTFDFQQVTNDVRVHVQVRKNKPDSLLCSAASRSTLHSHSNVFCHAQTPNFQPIPLRFLLHSLQSDIPTVSIAISSQLSNQYYD